MISVIIGGLIASISGVIVAIINGIIMLKNSKKTLDFELKKIYLPILKDKLITLESIKLKNSILLSRSINSNQETKILKDYDLLLNIFTDYSHYFIDSDLYQTIKQQQLSIQVESENDIETESNNLSLLAYKMEFNNKMNQLIIETILKFEKEIKVICTTAKQ